MDAPDFDYAVAVNLARDVVAKHWRLADATRADPAALMHDLVVEAWKSRGTFKLGRGAAWTTWAFGVMYRRLIDQVRRRERVERLEQQAASPGRGRDVDYGVECGAGGGGGGVLEREPGRPRSVSFFSSACSEIVLRIPNRIAAARHGRIGHSPRAYAGALAYRESKGLSWSELMTQLREQPGLLQAFGFKSIPHRVSVVRSRRRLWDWARRGSSAG